jgi:hypothetical protein
MQELQEKFLNISTYGFTGVGIVVNFDNIKSVVLFALGLILLVLQIILHVKKIKNENLNKK